MTQFYRLFLTATVPSAVIWTGTYWFYYHMDGHVLVLLSYGQALTSFAVILTGTL